MMGNSLLECCVFGARGQGRGGEGGRMSDRRDRHPEGRRGRSRVPVRLGAQGHPAGSARRDRDARERETSTPGQRVLDTIIRNVSIADDQTTLVCQDTGIAVYYCRVGEHFPLHPARIYEALYDGTERATVEHPLRSNTVHTLTRENTGQNVGYRVPIVHWDFVPTGTGSTSSACRRARAPRT